MQRQKVNVFWFRRDLRLDDNLGLYAALSEGLPVLPIFIFDSNILDKLTPDDARVTFIHETLASINSVLKLKHKRQLAVYYGNPLEVFKELTSHYLVQNVFANKDYEPYALERDLNVSRQLERDEIGFKSFKDQVIFEQKEIVKNDGNPYVVYTPFKNKWKEAFNAQKHLEQHPSEKELHFLIEGLDLAWVTLEDMGFKKSTIQVPAYNTSSLLISNYEKTRDFPAAVDGTSRLGPHLRFGTVSVRKLVSKAISEPNEIFWNQLIWREFFMQILWHFPHTKDRSFKPKYDRIDWVNNEADFEKWKAGQTGYALVDAGMRQLNTTGFMHNRVRMLVASFLCKHLLIDWRWGEAYFAEKLLDYDMSANVGNWQWAAGSGVDAAPYFRIFNPMTQIQKFDKQHEYIQKWVPELQELNYPPMMIDHKLARERCLKTYKEALS